jgi:hypothetical protein
MFYNINNEERGNISKMSNNALKKLIEEPLKGFKRM